MSRTIRNKPDPKAPYYWCNPLRKWIYWWSDDCFYEWWHMRGKYKKKREDRDYKEEIQEAVTDE